MQQTVLFRSKPEIPLIVDRHFPNGGIEVPRVQTLKCVSVEKADPAVGEDPGIPGMKENLIDPARVPAGIMFDVRESVFTRPAGVYIPVCRADKEQTLFIKSTCGKRGVLRPVKLMRRLVLQKI